MKLLDILREAEFLKKPEKVYEPEPEEIEGEEVETELEDIVKLSPQQQKELFKKGFLIVGTKVYNLPKLDKMRRNLIMSKKEFEAFQYHPDEDIKTVAKDINKLHNELYSSMKALDKMLELKKAGKL